MTIDFTAKLENIFNFKHHPMAKKYLDSTAPIRMIIKGNQGGGTATAMLDAAMRVLGVHTDNEKNRLSGDPIRFVSKVQPIDHDDEANQQFVEFRRLIPPELWAKKLTARSKIGRIKRLVGGTVDVEFMGSTQEIDAFMSVQRSAYYQDEEIERLKWDECRMRLATPSSKGFYADTSLTMTAVKGMDWSYDSLWRRANKIYRSKICADYGSFPEVVENDNKSGIEAFCWASDDNPVLTKDALDNLFFDVDDDDTLALRRYAIFRQVSGRIYKVFDEKIHVVPFDSVFDASVFRNYWHYRVLDYHPSKPWYTTWIAVSPTHEWFIWNEMKSDHDKKTIQELRDDIKSESLLDEDDEYNRKTLIDPLSKVSKVKSSPSVFDELSMGDLGLRRCQSADTKDGKSDSSHRSMIKTRLKNSVLCQVPGNNHFPNLPPDIRFGHYKPTLWFLDNCKGHIEHFKSWRYVDYKQEHVKATRTVKKESQKWSDYCRNVEFLGALNPVYYDRVSNENWHKSKLFQGRRA